MGKEMIAKVGILYYSLRPSQCVSSACEELGLNPKRWELDALDRIEYEVGDRLPMCYIRADGNLYRVTEEEAPSKCVDGSRVEFLTPVIQRGKFKWAYDVKLLAK